MTSRSPTGTAPVISYPPAAVALAVHAARGLAVGGQRIAAANRMAVVDPGTGLAFADVPDASREDVDTAVAAARAAFSGGWGRSDPAQRGAILRRVAGLLRRDVDVVGAIECMDSGKPLAEARREVLGAAAYFEYYAGAADKTEGRTIPQPDGQLSMTLLEAIGVSAQILPSNYPLGTAARGVAPALAAGCTVVAKPSDHTPLTALVLADLLHEAGLPGGVYNVVPGRAEVAGSALAAHPGVDQVTFTGSLSAGRKVLAASVPWVRPVALELGGKSPLVVLSDADVEEACTTAIKFLFTHAGQVCSAPSLVILDRPIAEKALALLVSKARALTVDHGLRDASLGAIASAHQLERIDSILRSADAQAAEVLCGGAIAQVAGCSGGAFRTPAVVLASDGQCPLAREEIFGPVMTVLVVDGLDAALTVANEGDYGLVAGIFTSSIQDAMHFAGRVAAGQVYVNGWHLGGVQSPFGGVKRSGIGRERGLAALDKYLQIKNVVIQNKRRTS